MVILKFCDIVSRFCAKARIKAALMKAYVYSYIFNHAVLPKEQARLMPIWLVDPKFRFCSIFKPGYRIEIDCDKVTKKMIKIGVPFNSWVPQKGATLQFGKGSKITFKGRAIIGNGSTLCLLDGSNVEFGDNFSAAAGFKLISMERITIGPNVMIGWDVMMVDTNFHPLTYTLTNEKTPLSSPIRIAGNNWIGFNTVIMPGFVCKENITIAANSTCSRKVKCDKYSVVGHKDNLEVLVKDWAYDFTAEDKYRVK